MCQLAPRVVLGMHGPHRQSLVHKRLPLATFLDLVRFTHHLDDFVPVHSYQFVLGFGLGFIGKRRGKQKHDQNDAIETVEKPVVRPWHWFLNGYERLSVSLSPGAVNLHGGRGFW